MPPKRHPIDQAGEIEAFCVLADTVKLLVADMALGRKPGEDVSNFLPERFGAAASRGAAWATVKARGR